MKSFISLLATSALLCAWNEALALDVNNKMGKPTQEELTMTEYTPDPEAEAVVLYSETSVRYESRANDLRLVTRYKRRIKVLKEDGKESGDVEVVVYNNENGMQDKISGLKGTTYNLENGSVTKSKLSADLKNEQRLDQYHIVKKFSMPNVRVGSVLEYEFEITSEDISTIDTWYAQEEIPVFHTEFEIVVPEWFKFRINPEMGRHKLEHKQEAVSFSALFANGMLSASATKDVFIGHELPHLKDDDYVSCANDYCSRVTMDIISYIVPGIIYKTFNQDWSHELGNLMKSDYFGRLCKRNSPFEKEEMKNIQWPEDFTLKQKIDSLRNLLWSQYSWDESYNLYARNIRNLNREKSGSNATLNFALMNMLNDADLPAYPVVMSSRKRGRLPIMPSQKYLNAMVLAVYDESDSTYIYFDAGSKDYPVGVIPSQFLASKAFMLDPTEKKYYTKNLSDVCRGSEVATAKITITNDGLMTGKQSVVHRGMEAANFRARYKMKTDEQEWLQQLVTANDVDDIEDYTVENVNNTKESVIEEYSIRKQLDIEGDHIYVNPFLGKDFNSPFKAETRDLPVEFRNNSVQKYTLEITIPDAYEVESLPQNINVKMPDGKLTARITCRQMEGKVHFNYNFNLNTLIYQPSEYELLRNFFTVIEQSGNTKLVLKKK